MHCLCKQCSRSQLIWICTVYLSVFEFISTIWIKKSGWLKIRSRHGILSLFSIKRVNPSLAEHHMPCLNKQCRSRSVEEANWSGSALFVIKYVNFYQKLRLSNLIGWRLEVGVASWFIQHDKGKVDMIHLGCVLPFFKEDNFCLTSCTPGSFLKRKRFLARKGVYSKRKEFAPLRGANSFLLE